MNKLKLVTFVSSLLGIIPSVLMSGETSAIEKPGYMKCELKAGGMSCGSCANRINAALNQKLGVKKSKVDLESGKAYVEYDPAIIKIEELVQTIQETGFQSSMPETKDVTETDSPETKDKIDSK